MKIGIVGNGYVGQATALLGEREDVDVLIWDIDEHKRNISSLEELKGCDLVFVCVPTPMNNDGSCYLKIVEDVVNDLTKASVSKKDIVIRSTVPVGTCEKLNVSFMPEFLTEANWREDFKNTEEWIFGFDAPELLEDRLAGGFTSEKMFKLAELSGKKVNIIKTKEAELVKYVRNAFLTTKISFFNEMEELCGNLDISYEEVRRSVCDDERIGHSHSQVPGPDGKRGYGGTCLPKDVSSLLFQMLGTGMLPYLIIATRTRNIERDRPEKDWESDKGRAVV